MGVLPSPKLLFEGDEATRSPLKDSPCPVAYGTFSDAEAQNNTCTHLPSAGRGGGDTEAQPFVPSSSALGWQDTVTTHLCLTVGDPELPTSTHTPLS